MALLFAEGFDWLDPVNNGTQIRNLLRSQKWKGGATSVGWLIQTGRGGEGQALQGSVDTINHILTTGYLQDVTLDSEFIFGGAVKLGANFVDNRSIWRIQVGGQVQIAIRFETSDNSFRVFRGDLGSTIATSPNLSNVLTLEAWQYVEWKLRISNTNGFLVLRINGEIVWESSVVLDTKFIVGASLWDTLWFRPGGWSPVSIWDDIYICNNVGPDNSNFLGDIKIRVITPNKDGSQTQFTPSTPGDHVGLIDEFPFLDQPTDTDYVETAQLGGLELFEFTDIPTSQTGDVLAVQVNSISRLTDGQPKRVFPTTQLKNHNEEVVVGPHDVTGNSTVRQDEYADSYGVFQTDPNGKRWNTRNLNKAQFGVKLES